MMKGSERRHAATNLIFDCDGVLVDSEVISMSVLLEILSSQGLVIGPAEAYDKFLGPQPYNGRRHPIAHLWPCLD